VIDVENSKIALATADANPTQFGNHGKSSLPSERLHFEFVPFVVEPHNFLPASRMSLHPVTYSLITVQQSVPTCREPHPFSVSDGPKPLSVVLVMPTAKARIR
jgi:hypothetical protein